MNHESDRDNDKGYLQRVRHREFVTNTLPVEDIPLIKDTSIQFGSRDRDGRWEVKWLAPGEQVSYSMMLLSKHKADVLRKAGSQVRKISFFALLLGRPAAQLECVDRERPYWEDESAFGPTTGGPHEEDGYR